MASGIYNVFKTNLMTKQVDLDNGGDTFKVALYDNNFSFNASQTTYSTTNELSTGNGYTQGGQTLTGQAVSGTSTVKWTANAVQWTATGDGFTAYYALIYDVTASNHCVCCFDFGGGKTASGGGTFTITWHTNGILDLS